jgi:nitrile hydratase subunit beta
MAINAQQALTAAAAGASSRVDEAITPRFKPGDQIRVRNINPAGHTRMPRYIRGKVGKVEIDHGVFVFPDTLVAKHDKKPQHVYCVYFTAHELWGKDASNKDGLMVDVWDDYMDLA